MKGVFALHVLYTAQACKPDWLGACVYLQKIPQQKGNGVSKNVRYALIVLVVVLAWLLSGLLIGNDESVEKENTDNFLTHVEVATSTAEHYQPSLMFNARTEPFRLVHLRAETEGPLVAASVAEGTEVKQGTLVGKIGIQERALRVVEAQSLVEQVQLEYQGALELKTKDLLSDAEIARKKFDVDSAKTLLDAAKIELSRVDLKAPFDGVLNERFYEVGDYLQRGQIFAEFLQLDPLKVVFQVSEKEIIKLDPQGTVEIALADGRVREGRVVFRSAKADQQSRAFKVEAVFDNPGNEILADLTGRATITLKQITAHAVPASVLSLGTQGQLIIKTLQTDQTVGYYPVQIVADEVESVWVTGLPGKVDVVISGHEYVGIGEQVKVSRRQAADAAIVESDTPAMEAPATKPSGS